MLFGGGAAGAAEDARVFKDDHSILELVDGTPQFETQMDRARARRIGTLAFDESQDMYLTIYRAIRPFLEATVDTTQIIVVGDSPLLRRQGTQHARRRFAATRKRFDAEVLPPLKFLHNVLLFVCHAEIRLSGAFPDGVVRCRAKSVP